jgi:diguanylate cyclase (GGDEF)-like protein
VITDDISRVASWHPHPQITWERSNICAPLHIREKVIGFLSLASATPAAFNSFDAVRLQAFTHHAAIAIDNARLYEDMNRLNITDSLTETYNRSYFERELARMGNDGRSPVSMVVADLDNMKLINDSLGHIAGDDLLKRTATLLKSVFRSADVVARIGGDEFGVLLPRTDADAMEKMIQRVRARLDEHNTLHPDLAVQLSLGSSTAVQCNLMEAFKEADRSMYQEKARRKSKTDNRSGHNTGFNS